MMVYYASRFQECLLVPVCLKPVCVARLMQIFYTHIILPNMHTLPLAHYLLRNIQIMKKMIDIKVLFYRRIYLMMSFHVIFL